MNGNEGGGAGAAEEQNDHQLQASWLKPMEQILTILRLTSTWDSIRLSECLKLLFREILLPTYGPASSSSDDNKFVEFFKSYIYPKLE